MAKAETTAATTRAPRGAKPVAQAFLAALESVPEAAQSAVAKAAQVMIRDEIKNEWIFHYVEIEKDGINFDAHLLSVKNPRITRFSATLSGIKTASIPTTSTANKRTVKKVFMSCPSYSFPPLSRCCP